jgi:hypothetical protein
MTSFRIYLVIIFITFLNGMRLKGIFPSSFEGLLRTLCFLLAWFLCFFFAEYL